MKVTVSFLLALCMGCATSGRQVARNLPQHGPSMSTDRTLLVEDQRRNEDLARASKAISDEDWTAAAEALAAAYKRSPEDRAVRYYVMLYVLSWNQAMERATLNRGLGDGFE